jgi:hypothetical protein
MFLPVFTNPLNRIFWKRPDTSVSSIEISVTAGSSNSSLKKIHCRIRIHNALGINSKPHTRRCCIILRKSRNPSSKTAVAFSKQCLCCAIASTQPNLGPTRIMPPGNTCVIAPSNKIIKRKSINIIETLLGRNWVLK